MFVTRAGRHDKADLKEFIELRRDGDVDITRGTAMIAREGSIIGCIRLIEVEPDTLVYDDLLVAEDRDDGVARQLIQAAMNNKGGRIFTAASAAESELFIALGFEPIDRLAAPEPVAEYWDSQAGPSDDLVHLRAR